MLQPPYYLALTTQTRLGVRLKYVVESLETRLPNNLMVYSLLVQVYQQGVELRQSTKVGLGLRGLG